MATDDTATADEELETEALEPDDVTETDLEEIEGDLDLDAEAEGESFDDAEEGDDDASGDDEEGLEEMEAEELEMLTEDEASESIAVDEVAELRALRREEREMDVDPEQAGADEFVCQSCFLVKRINQLADRRKRYCRDCVA